MTPRTAWFSQSCQDTTIKCYLAWMDLGCSDLFERHMQSGHGKVYTDSFALFISMPLASLCALILNNCRFSDFHLHKPNQNLNKMKNICLKVKNVRASKKRQSNIYNKWQKRRTQYVDCQRVWPIFFYQAWSFSHGRRTSISYGQ